MSGTLCVTCGARTNAFLCKRCGEQVETAIGDMVADLDDLQAVAARQARGPLGLGDRSRQWDGPFEEGALGDAPWEFAPGAADQIWAVVNTLTTWTRHLAESRGTTPPASSVKVGRRLYIERNRLHVFVERRHSLMPVISWLLCNIEAIRHDEAAEQIHEELTTLPRENERWIVPRGVEEFAGRCDSDQVTFRIDGDQVVPVAATCGVAIYGRKGERDVRCTGCGTTYVLADRLEEMRSRQINEQLARAHTIANALTTIDEPLSSTLLRKWIERDAKVRKAPEGPACEACRHLICALIRRPVIRCKGFDEEGHSLYRVGDVRARLALVQEQRGIKLSA